MKKIASYITGLFLLFAPVILAAQTMPVNDPALSQRYPFISTIFNRVLNSAGLDSFYQKLYTLKTTHTGVVSVVHIGDSHIQAGSLTGVVRTGLQDFFGNAGRGLVFPYQLAQSNAPDDITSSSNIRWQYNRVAHPEIAIDYGISGYGIRAGNTGASINLSLRPVSWDTYAFNRLKFFLGDNSSWIMQADNGSVPYMIRQEAGDTSLYQPLVLERPATGFSLSALPGDADKAFFGVSLENAEPGILYHTIGVNGARYDQYNTAPLFWQQLPALEADLYIVSLGTNEAQRVAFIEPAFINDISVFIQKLRQASPHAAIIITTAPDSYKGRRSNTVLRALNKSLTDYCNKNYIPLWDLYRITNGYGSAYSWIRRGLMSRDRVHFTPEGYRLQGSLLLNALASGYNNYVTAYSKH